MAPVDDGGIVLLTEDATERKATAARIEHMARFDELTGLANRFEFETQLDDACRRLAHEGWCFSVLYIDLDNFKQINDNLGHVAGDLVLTETTKRLRVAMSSEDLIARFGGDEFLVILYGANITEARQKGRRVVEAMNEPFEVAGKNLFVSASVGVAAAPEHGHMRGDIMRHADIALYRAKQGGRNTSVSFEPSMARQLLERHELEIELRHAFEREMLEMHYQPLIDIKSGKIASFEALMRWPHPNRGMIPPNLFIPIAEQTGLIAGMGNWAIRQACIAATAWPEEVSVAVNVSPLQFRQSKKLINAVKEALAASGLSPARLALEVTESLLIEDQRATLNAIRELRKIGVKLSLDDFGSGYSSLAYLSTYPFTQVKIDRAFAKDVTTNFSSRSIIEAVCQLAHRLGMQVVVEGIETEEQRRAIEIIGVDRGQGYLFGKPMKSAMASDLFRAAA
ncbi:MAG: EAL domain-containing protein [Comamonadaceae bacterium]|nr:EAL domain-containing protein [Comamonadaceae bacterium]